MENTHTQSNQGGVFMPMQKPADDSVKLLQEIYAGTQLIISCIDTIKGRSSDQKFADTLWAQRQSYEEIEGFAVTELRKQKVEPKGKGFMQKAAAWSGIQLNALIDKSNRRTAELLIETATMGINDMIEGIFDYPAAEEAVRQKAESLMHLNEQLINSQKYFLTH